MISYYIEYRTVTDPIWRRYHPPEDFPTAEAAQDRCRYLEFETAGHTFRVVRARDLRRPASRSWRAKLEGSPLDQLAAEIRERLADLDQKRLRLQERLDDVLAHTPVECLSNCYGKGCGKRTPVKDLVYIQTHYYVAPSGCTGGDYWLAGEGQFDCPECGHRNRLYNRPMDDLRHLFRGVTMTYDR